MDEINQELFQPKGYLSPAQIEIAKNKVPDLMNGQGQSDLIALVDGFVRSNGTADEKYEKIFSLLNEVKGMCMPQSGYPERVAQTMPMVYGLLFYNYAILVGLVTEEDIMEMQRKAAEMFGQGVPHQGIPKA